MNCLNPLQLRSGLVVPCGKCLLCLSSRRDEWSIRLQLHTLSYDNMPFFCTFTYDPSELVYGDNRPTLVRSHVTGFIKRLKDRYDLYNSKFSYFGCGEYGDKLARPHAHILFFGFDELQKTYQRSWLDAHKMLRDVWKHGNVDVGVAEYSGIHYVTKYVLKYDSEDYQGIERPFIVYSQGIGKNWFSSREAKYLKSRIDVAQFRRVAKAAPELDFTDLRSLSRTANDTLLFLQRYLPNLSVSLPNGNRVALPRYFRRKLFGSFEHFKDNPFWIVDHVRTLRDMADYLISHGEYDITADCPYSALISKMKDYKIRKRLLIKSQL